MEELGSATLVDGELHLQLTEFAPHHVHKVPTYHFRMVHAGTEEELGGINLRIASNAHIELYAGHVGYTVYPAHRGHRYAARSIRLLAHFARRLSLIAYGSPAIRKTLVPGEVPSWQAQSSWRS